MSTLYSLTNTTSTRTLSRAIRFVTILAISLAMTGSLTKPIVVMARAERSIPVQTGEQAAAPLITGTVTLWHAYGLGSGEDLALSQVIQNAEAANPDLTIISVRHAWPDIFTNYENAVLAGGGPDMFIVPNDELGNHMRAGVIRNLNTYLQGRLTNVSQKAINGMNVNGQLFGVPESAKAVALYYNKSMVSTPPLTTAGLLALLQSGETLVADGVNGSYFFYGFWSAFGGQLMNSSGRCIADQGGFVPAMQYLLDLQAAGAVLQIDGSVAESLFLNGESGMLINGPWDLAEFEAALGNDLGVIRLPSGPSGPAQAMNGIDGFYINPNTTNFVNTIELALYMTNQASSQIFTNVGKHVPVRSDVASTDPLVNRFAQASNQGAPRPQNEQLNNYWGPFNEMIKDVLAGNLSPQVGVQRACKTMDWLNGFAVSDSLRSAGTYDGWILESSETSNNGGTMNVAQTTFQLGDDAIDKQYRAILSFNTGGLPDDAVITKLTLKIKQQSQVCTNPFTTHNGLRVDIRNPYFGTLTGLQVSDFQAAASRNLVGTFGNTPTNGWYSVNLSATAFQWVNRTGTTQFRLRFGLDDNNDNGADFMKFFSGNATAADRPMLIINYHAP
jgi:arabinogalactan oligomer / maltooligosaccharide transport system substrate-binding protein